MGAWRLLEAMCAIVRLVVPAQLFNQVVLVTRVVGYNISRVVGTKYPVRTTTELC